MQYSENDMKTMLLARHEYISTYDGPATWPSVASALRKYIEANNKLPLPFRDQIKRGAIYSSQGLLIWSEE